MTTFHPFFWLPFELRVQIWEMTVEPRTVDVQIKYRDREPPILISSTPIPGPIHICREARNLKLYQQAFSEIPEESTERRYIWANLHIDMISIGTTPFENYRAVAPSIRRLKFEGTISDSLYYHFEMKGLRYFVNVREVHAVCADGLGAWWGATEEHYWPCGRENVFMIDPEDGRMMSAKDVDEMVHQEFKDDWAKEGYDYDTGAPLR